MFLAFRRRVNRHRDRAFFRDTAKRTKAINLSVSPQRGGIRL